MLTEVTAAVQLAKDLADSLEAIGAPRSIVRSELHRLAAALGHKDEDDLPPDPRLSRAVFLFAENRFGKLPKGDRDQKPGRLIRESASQQALVTVLRVRSA